MSLALHPDHAPSRTTTTTATTATTAAGARGGGCSYRFELPSGPLLIHVDYHRRPSAVSPAPWTALTTHQCPNCPLRDTPTCPAAADLAPVVDALGDLASVQRLDVVVIQAQRETRQTVTGEAAARAIIGLMMATSDCPVLSKLRPLAMLHLPFATPQEATFRFAAAHLLRQFFDGQALDLEELRNQMDDLHVVNAAFAARLKAACSKDAIPNALTALFSLSMIVSDEAEMGLSGLRELFVSNNQ